MRDAGCRAEIPCFTKHTSPPYPCPILFPSLHQSLVGCINISRQPQRPLYPWSHPPTIIVRLGPVTVPPICYISPPLQHAGRKRWGRRHGWRCSMGTTWWYINCKAKLLPIRFYSQLNCKTNCSLCHLPWVREPHNSALISLIQSLADSIHTLEYKRLRGSYWDRQRDSAETVGVS